MTRHVLFSTFDYRRFASLGRAHRRLLIEAAMFVAFVSVGLRVMPYLQVRRLLDRWVELRGDRNRGPTSPSGLASVKWAVTTAAARFAGATCLVQALAAEAMLRRRGYGCQLRIGVRRRDGGVAPIEAHAWVECDGRIAIGDVDDLSALAVMAAPDSP